MARLLIMAVGLAVAAGGVVVPANAAGDGYSAYVACGRAKKAPPSHECKLSDSPTAFFVTSRHDATYKVCVKFPGKKKRLCASAQPADKGQKARVTITTGNPGTHKATWYVDGEKVATWKFQMVDG